ncbi:thioredoxin, mitochondrial-like isoform X1 [Homarus americanus]|uniref:Thioredoxin-like 1 n=1 Tax=Homarus americanus TaxID=6706 RepID=A0A8J5NCI1_HOMAM|nr:thioredoxin, mitochondrial-like isoform X1 [Homarus americanus]KAG7177053.1 Thioredoxin-like 1 [Homarus americanus]
MTSNPAMCKFLQRIPVRSLLSISTQGQLVTASPGSRNFHQSEPLMDIFEIQNEDEFKNKVMRNSLPVIVNFHADWCEPCHSLRPLLKKIATENVGQLHLAEVLVDEHAELLQAFEVTAVPAVLGIHRGMVIEKFVGLVTHKEVKGFVEKLLHKNSE